MNPRIKQLWIDALRSGEYAKGNGVLYDRTDNTFCCLGVLCDIAARQGYGTWTRAGYFRVGVTSCSDHPPARVLEWAGLDSKHILERGTRELGSATVVIPSPINAKRKQRLDVINDLTDLDFSDIADLIEEHL